MDQFKIRLLTTADIPQVLEIYKPFIIATSFTPEYDVPKLESFSARVNNIANEYPFLVCEVGDTIAGYAYANQYRLAQGHLWSVETSIYLGSGYHGKGIAKILYQSLFAILRLQNYFNAFAGIVLPNKRSELFHESFGFCEVGVFKTGIYKLEEWHDVKWFQLSLQEHFKNPSLPKSIIEVKRTKEFSNILKQATDTCSGL